MLDSTTGGTVPLRVTVSGNVDLIIADGVDITFEEGIHVPWGSSLTIYGQSGQTGTLKAAGSKHNAGIGGNGDDTACGIITINSGNVICRRR